MSYGDRLGHPEDFEVRYRFFTPEEGGRFSGPPWQHFRGDWAYADDTDSLYAIHPEFLSIDGEVLPEGEPVPWEGRASMWILIPERRAEIHRGKIQIGVRGYFMEGPKKVAEAIVTQIIGLPTNPDI